MVTVALRRSSQRPSGLLVTALLTVSVVMAGCSADAEPDPAEYLKGTVYVGVNSDLPGWSLYKNGVWDGFDIKLANWLGQQLGFRPQFVALATDERVPRLEENTGSSNDVKLVIANFSITDPRREKIDFAGPYFLDAQALLTRSDSKVTGIQDLAGKRVCVSSGSTTEFRLAELGVVPTTSRTLEGCVQRLTDGTADVVTTDKALLEGFASRDRRLRVVPNVQVGTERYGIGIKNASPELCRLLTEKLKIFINEEWDRKLQESIPGIDATEHKPNSDLLDTCERPT